MSKIINKTDEEKEQELKDEFINSMLRAAAILRKADREADARELEITAGEIADDWMTALEQKAMIEQEEQEQAEAETR